jgi:hypothetical protein
MIFQAGSKVLTYKPGADSDADVDEVEGEAGEEHSGKTNISEDTYKTPVILRTNRRARPVEVIDSTESELEIVVTKGKKATGVSPVPSSMRHND